MEKEYLLPQYSTLDENRGIEKTTTTTTVSHKVIGKFDHVKSEKSTGQRSVHAKSKDKEQMRRNIFNYIKQSSFPC